MSANLSKGTDVQILWGLESLGVTDKDETSITKKCLIKQFEDNLKFNDGHYETQLLWKDSSIGLESNFTRAKNGLMIFRNKFKICH